MLECRLDGKPAAVRLEDADMIHRQLEGREATHQLGRREHFVADMMEVGAGQSPAHEGAVRRSDLHDSSEVEKRKPARCSSSRHNA